MSENKKNQNSDNKIEIANKIANQSKKVVKTYAHIEDSVLRIFRWFSTWIDKAIFNSRYGKVISLIMAILLYLTVNFNSENSLFASKIQNSRDKVGVGVTIYYNEETFEVSGIPNTVNITITGDSSNVNAAYNSEGVVVANLEGLTEGVHNVRLSTKGFGDSVTVKTDPSNVSVTLRKKTTRQFDLSYDFINLDKMDNIYSAGTPEFEYTKVNVRASKETLDSIAYVKALIDVSNQTAEFTNQANLVAYDQNGQPVKADIVPSTVTVTVPVTSPNKTVPIVVEATGDVVEGMAVDSIKMDQQTVTIYGAESVLSKIDQVVVTLDMSTITKDSTLVRPITLPTGVNSSSTNQVTMDVVLKEAITKTVDGVTINYRNNTNNYRFGADNSVVSVSVEVTGTEKNIQDITADDIVVYFDMANAVLGPQEFPLVVEQPVNTFVKYTLTQTTYKGVVVGEGVDQSNDDATGGTE